jgi:hypothetical protein
MIDTWTSIIIPDDAKLSGKSLAAMMEWCNKNISKELDDWAWTYSSNNILPSKYVFEFRFKDKEHAILFKLIWV